MSSVFISVKRQVRQRDYKRSLVTGKISDYKDICSLEPWDIGPSAQQWYIIACWCYNKQSASLHKKHQVYLIFCE